MHRRTGFLLLEVIIVLFILSLVVIPWTTFMGAIQKNQTSEQLSEYFLTKEVFLKAYNGEIAENNYVSAGKKFSIIKEQDMLFVRLIDGEIVKEEIKGKLL